MTTLCFACGFQVHMGLAADPLEEENDVWWQRVFVFSYASLLLLSAVTHRQPRRNVEHHQLERRKAKVSKWSLVCQHKAQCCDKLDGISTGAPVEAPTASSSDLEHPITISVPEMHGTPHTISSRRLAGSQEESNTKTQKLHDVIFRYRRPLNTSLWKRWVATILFQQMKTNGIWRIKTNTMANQEYRPHPPAQSLTKNLHVAECPQMWILLLHFQSLFPSYTSSPQNYSLRLPLRSDHHLLRLPPMLSSRNVFPPWRPHLKQGTKWKLGTELLAETPLSMASSRSSLAALPPKGDVIPISLSVVHIILKIEWRHWWTITWWTYIFTH